VKEFLWSPSAQTDGWVTRDLIKTSSHLLFELLRKLTTKLLKISISYTISYMKVWETFSHWKIQKSMHGQHYIYTELKSWGLRVEDTRKKRGPINYFQHFLCKATSWNILEELRSMTLELITLVSLYFWKGCSSWLIIFELSNLLSFLFNS
jgi:hypothetical protein